MHDGGHGAEPREGRHRPAHVHEYVDAGYDEVYLSQIGREQDGFLDVWERDLRAALESL